MTLPHAREAASPTETLVSPGVLIRGKMTGGPDDVIRVEGRLQGEVETEGRLIVAEGGRVLADVKGREVIVAGVLQGNVLFAERLVAEKTAEIYGDVRAAAAVIEDGALIAGKLEVRPEVLAQRENRPAPVPSPAQGAPGGSASAV